MINLEKIKEIKNIKQITIIIVAFILLLVIMISMFSCGNENKKNSQNKETTTIQNTQSPEEKEDLSNAESYEKIVTTALQDYATAESNNFEDYQNGNKSVVTSIAAEEEILHYKTINAIVRAGKKGETDGPDSLAGISWEYKVYLQLKTYLTTDTDSKPLLQPKQTDKKFYIKIEGSCENGYGVTVKCAEEYPFAGAQAGESETGQDADTYQVNHNYKEAMIEKGISQIESMGMFANYIAFFDLDMDGMLELFIMDANADNALYGYAYQFVDGNYQEYGDVDLSTNEEDYYTVYKTPENEYVFLTRGYYTEGYPEEVIGLQYIDGTQEMICYCCWNVDDNGEEYVVYYDVDGNEISEQTYNELLGNAIKGWKKLDISFEVISLREYQMGTNTDLSALLTKAYDGFNTGKNQMIEEPTTSSQNENPVEPDIEGDEIDFEVQHNGGTVIQINGNKYYWKYNTESYTNAALRANYFYNPSTQNQLICMDEDGNEEIILTANGVGKLWVIQNQLYFHKPLNVNQRTYAVYKMKYRNGRWDGSTIEQVFEGEILEFSEAENMIIYKSETYAPHNVFTYSVDTKENQLLIDNGQYFVYQNGRIYFSKYSGKDLVISSVNLYGEEQELTTIRNEEGTTLEMENMQMIDDYLYFSYGYTDGNLHEYYLAEIARMNKNGGNYETVSETELGWFYVYEENSEIKLLKDVVKDKVFVSGTGMACVYTGESGTPLEIVNLKEKGYGSSVELMVDVRNLEIIGDKLYYTIYWNRYSTEASMGWRDGYVREKSEVYEKDMNSGVCRLLYTY